MKEVDARAMPCPQSVLLAKEALKASGSFITFGFRNMPVSHSNYLWNLIAVLLAGMCFSLDEGCPGRQLLKTAGGYLNSVHVIAEMFTGAAIHHNCRVAAVPERIIHGTTVNNTENTLKAVMMYRE